MDDQISRRAALRILDAAFVDGTEYQGYLHERFEKLPSAQPEITPDGTLKVTVDADIASVGRILLSQTGTQRGGLYYKDAQPEETCDTCKYGYFGDGMCDYCRVRYQSHYERRTDEPDK